MEDTLISQDTFQRIFRITDKRTFKSYIDAGLLPTPVLVDNEIKLSRKEILNLFGLKEFPEEPFMTAAETAEYLNVKQNYLISFARNKGIPLYKISNAKGSLTLYLKSEIDLYLKSNFDHYFGCGIRNFLNLYSNEFIIKFLLNSKKSCLISKKQYDILYDILIENKRISTIAHEQKCTKQNIEIHLNKGFHKLKDLIIDHLNNINEFISLEEENKLLKEQIRILTAPKEDNKDFLKVFKEPDKIYNHISVRAFNFLYENKIYSIFNLSKYSLDHIKKFRNIGDKTIYELTQLLHNNNLDWKQE